MMEFDIIIIGAGPIGLNCGIVAKKSGLNYLIIEKGCLVNSLYNYPQNMTFFSTSEKLEIGGVPFVSTNPKPNRSEALEYYRRVALKFDLKVNLFERVKSLESKKGSYIIETDKRKYKSKYIIIASGFYDLPSLLNIPGENLDKVKHYYKDPHYFSMQKVVVVGSSNSSVDAALECYRKGAEVTMVIRGSQIGERVKYWVRPDIINRIAEGSIKVYFNSTLTQISDQKVEINTLNGKVEIPNDFVLALTGYQPDFSFLKKLGIKLSSDEKQYPTYNDKTMETNRKGLYLAGVICGGMDTHLWFIENSRIHANLIIQDILAKNHSV